jgi:hypothetical protein
MMFRQKQIAKTPREHFMRAADEELARFVNKEIEFQRSEREERAARLGLPVKLPKQGRPDNSLCR